MLDSLNTWSLVLLFSQYILLSLGNHIYSLSFNDHLYVNFSQTITTQTPWLCKESLILYEPVRASPGHEDPGSNTQCFSRNLWEMIREVGGG